MYKIGNLLHLISISLAIGLAYIALDRFRYTKRVKAMLSSAIEQIEKADKNPAGQDSALTQLSRKLKDVSDNGLGRRFFYIKALRMFGSGDKSGWDVYITNVLIVAEYFALLSGSLFPEETQPKYYWLIMGICVIGTVLPVLFIYSGAREISRNDSQVEEVLSCFSSAKGYDISINKLKDKLNN